MGPLGAERDPVYTRRPVPKGRMRELGARLRTTVFRLVYLLTAVLVQASMQPLFSASEDVLNPRGPVERVRWAPWRVRVVGLSKGNAERQSTRQALAKRAVGVPGTTCIGGGVGHLTCGPHRSRLGSRPTPLRHEPVRSSKVSSFQPISPRRRRPMPMAMVSAAALKFWYRRAPGLRNRLPQRPRLIRLASCPVCSGDEIARGYGGEDTGHLRREHRGSGRRSPLKAAQGTSVDGVPLSVAAAGPRVPERSCSWNWRRARGGLVTVAFDKARWGAGQGVQPGALTVWPYLFCSRIW